jgi:hypothetical protein
MCFRSHFCFLANKQNKKKNFCLDGVLFFDTYVVLFFHRFALLKKKFLRIYIHAQENGNAVYIEWVRNGGAFMGSKISLQHHLKKEKDCFYFYFILGTEKE